MATTTLRRASGSARFAPLALLLLLWFLGDSCVAFAQRWRQEPGRWEFTGKMVVRPLQIEHWMERGYTREQAQILYARAVAYTVDTLGEHVYRYHERMDEYWFHVPPGRSENDIGEQLIATGYYRYVCPNWRMGRDMSLDCTNDEFLGDQWHLKRLEACAGWQIHSSGHDDVVLAVIDAGLRTSHEDFSTLNQYRREGYNVTEGLWESENGTIWSQWYHGTIVTGAAAATGNNGVGTSGIGWSLRHRMLVAEDADDTFTAMEIAGMAGDRIIVSTASITPDSQTQGLWNDNTKWITEEFNVLIVQSGGNYPENDFLFNEFPYMIVVGGTDPSDNRWINGQGTSGSTVGPHLDVMAPAVDIFGPDWDDDEGYRSTNSIGSGTSWAAPQAAALCALIWSYNPSLSRETVRGLLYQGCEGFNGYLADRHGHGRINIFNSLALLSGDLWTRDPHPGVAGVSNKFKAAGAANGATVRFYYGSSIGQTAVSGCSNVYVGIADASILGEATAGSNGAAICQATVPSGWAGQTRYLQAVDLSDCRVSNLIEYTFPSN